MHGNERGKKDDYLDFYVKQGTIPPDLQVIPQDDDREGSLDELTELSRQTTK